MAHSATPPGAESLAPAPTSSGAASGLGELSGALVALGLLLAWAIGARGALAACYLLALCAGLSWSLGRALGRERLGRRVARLLLLVPGLLLAWSGWHPLAWPEQLPVPRNDFPGPAARVWYDVAPPAEWGALPGEPWVYVGIASEDPQALLAAGPVLQVDGQPAPVEVDPWAPRAWLRAPFPRSRLGREVRIAFGFERPHPGLLVSTVPWYRGTLPRVVSGWSADGAPPPPGAALPFREVGWIGRLAGQSSCPVSLWRLAIEVRVIEPGSATATAPARILAGCY